MGLYPPNVYGLPLQALLAGHQTRDKHHRRKTKNAGHPGTNKKIMNVEERIQKSETHIFKAVFPNTTNHYDTLFGGTAMHLMDEVAFITATRFSRQVMVTVSSDKIDFKRSIPAGTIIELVGRVSHVGNTSLRVDVEIYIEQMYAVGRELAIHGSFTFVAIDEHKKPVTIIK
jgi:acyl-CoA hydrolase